MERRGVPFYTDEHLKGVKGVLFTKQLFDIRLYQTITYTAGYFDIGTSCRHWHILPTFRALFA